MRIGRRFILVVAVLCLVVAGCDWTQVNFDGAQTRFNPYEPALTASSVQHITEAWSTDALPGALVANGVVYTYRLARGALALDLTTGALLWTATVPSGFPAAVGDGLVYCDGTALDAKTGVERWSHQDIAPSFIGLAGGRVFLAPPFGNTGLLYVVDPDGTIQDAVEYPGEYRGGVVDGGQVFVLSFVRLDNPPYGIVVLSTYESNGFLRRRVSVPARNTDGFVTPPTGTIRASHGLIYFKGAEFFAVDPTTGAIAWHTPVPSPGLREPSFQGVAVTPNAVVLTSGHFGKNPQLLAFNPRTGAPVWATNAAFGGEVSVAGDLVFVGNEVHDLRTGALIVAYDTSTVAPYVSIPAGGHIFVAGPRNNLVAMVPSS
jgi:outer membrane protein assembly factor BamB